jgi:hypothetical protein
MSRRFIVGVALVAALTIPGYVLAHERHRHKIMGTVSVRHENHLEVRAMAESSAVSHDRFPPRTRCAAGNDYRNG